MSFDVCERCYGAGCRYCSGRGWVERDVEPSPIEVPSHYLDQQVEAAGRPLPPILRPAKHTEPRVGTNKDTEADRGEVEHQELREAELVDTARALGLEVLVFDDTEPNWPRLGPDEPMMDENTSPSPVEPDERIRITVQYPGHTVKLLRVRYGALSQALAEAFNGRPWS